MSQKFKNKYRSETTRLKEWDYGWNASYFVTICTKDRKHYFGKISDSQFIPSPIGEIAEREWLKSFEMRPDMNLTMGEYVVMPNHFHAIIGIGENEYNTMDRMRNALRIHIALCIHNEWFTHNQYTKKQIRSTIQKFGIDYPRV